MEQLPLEIVGFNAIEVSDAHRADAGRGEIQGGGTPQTARANDQHASRGELLLTGDAKLTQQNVPAISRKFVGRKLGRFFGRH